MADLAKWRKNIPEGFDGRFGDQFDDEVLPKEILKISVGIFMLVVISVVICLVFYRVLLADTHTEAPPKSPMAEANERQIPPGPLLQSHPEGELEQMNAELAAQLGSFGWADEAHGVAHLPIDRAIDLVTAGHLPTPIFGSGEGTAPAAAGGDE